MLRLSTIVLALIVSLSSAGAIGFNREIRPILSNKCFACHGPDEKARKAKLRLDQRASALQVIKPGAPGESELMARVTRRDRDEMMPPPQTHKTITRDEIELLRAWIAEGAEYEAHWAFIPPTKTEGPEADEAIDHFVGKRLQQENLAPSKPAGRNALIRRVTLDLTGMPPTPAEVAAFLADDAPEAYGNLVDRLLASPATASTWRRRGSRLRGTPIRMATRTIATATSGRGAIG